MSGGVGLMLSAGVGSMGSMLGALGQAWGLSTTMLTMSSLPLANLLLLGVLLRRWRGEQIVHDLGIVSRKVS